MLLNRATSLSICVVFLSLTGCGNNPPVSLDALPSDSTTITQPGCQAMDNGQSSGRPCHSETPLLGKTLLEQPSLDEESLPSEGIHDPIEVTATFTPISSTADPDVADQFSVIGVADLLAPGVARSSGGSDVALKVQTGWTGQHRILYYTVETSGDVNNVYDVSGTKVLPDPDESEPTTILVADGAVPLSGRNYEVEISATIPPETLLQRLRQTPSSGLPQFPYEKAGAAIPATE